MKDFRTSRLIAHLQSLDQMQMRRLDKFLRSPFFTHATPTYSLFQTLRNFFPNFEDSQCTPDRIWGNVFPQKQFHQQRFWRLCSDLSKLIERFLVEYEVSVDTDLQQELYLRRCARNNDILEFNKKVNLLIKKNLAIENYALKDLERLVDYMTLSEDVNKNICRVTLNDDELTLDQLIDELYMAKKLQRAIHVLSYNSIFNTSNAEVVLLKEALEFDFKRMAEVANVYKYCVFVINGTERDILQLIELLKLNYQSIGSDDVGIFYRVCLNYCIRSYNQGEIRMIDIVIDLYNFGLERDIIYDKNGMLTLTTGINIVTQAVNAKKIEWANQFLNNYLMKIPEDHRHHLEKYAMALFFFEKQDYENCIYITMGLEFFRPSYTLLVKNLFIKASFEMFLSEDIEYDLLLTRLNTISVYMTRNKILTDTQKNPHSNLINLLKRTAFRIDRNVDPANLSGWFHETKDQIPVLASKKWLDDLGVKFGGSDEGPNLH